MEKQVLMYLHTSELMTTIGAITTSVDSISTLMNGERKRNVITPEFPWIGEKHIRKSLTSCKKRGIIDIQNKAGITIYFVNFLRWNRWSPSVYKSWPNLVANEVPEGPIQGVIVENTIRWMADNQIPIPEVWL